MQEQDFPPLPTSDVVPSRSHILYSSAARVSAPSVPQTGDFPPLPNGGSAVEPTEARWSRSTKLEESPPRRVDTEMLERNRRVAEGLGIAPRVGGSMWDRSDPLRAFEVELEAPKWPKDLIQWALKNIDMVEKLERRVAVNIADESVRNTGINLKPMPKEVRKKVHEWAEFYSVKHEACDYEPKRYIWIRKTSESKVPGQLLSEAARNYLRDSKKQQSRVASRAILQDSSVLLYDIPLKLSIRDIAIKVAEILDGYSVVDCKPYEYERSDYALVCDLESPEAVASFLERIKERELPFQAIDGKAERERVDALIHSEAQASEQTQEYGPRLLDIPADSFERFGTRRALGARVKEGWREETSGREDRRGGTGGGRSKKEEKAPEKVVSRNMWEALADEEEEEEPSEGGHKEGRTWGTQPARHVVDQDQW